MFLRTIVDYDENVLKINEIVCISLPPSCSITVTSVVVYMYSVELAVLKDFHRWSKGTVTLYMSASGATLSSPKTIVASQ